MTVTGADIFPALDSERLSRRHDNSVTGADIFPALDSRDISPCRSDIRQYLRKGQNA